MNIAVTAAYGRSLHAVALLNELTRRGHTVSLVLEVSVWRWRRVRHYLRQLGLRKLIARVRTRMLGGAGHPQVAPEVEPMREYLRAHAIAAQTVREAARQVGARHLTVADLNSPPALEALRAANCDLVVYAGGGIVRGEFLGIPRHGVLNAHGGPLPYFRGMNASEWSLWYGVKPEIVTLLVDAGVDTGPILRRYPLGISGGDAIPAVRGRGTRASVEALLDTVDALAAGTLRPQPQSRAAGRQHFVMAEPLLAIIERNLARGELPQRSAAEFELEPLPPPENNTSWM